MPETGDGWRPQSAVKAVAGKEIIGPGGKKVVVTLFDKAIADHLILTVYESWGKREAADIIKIFRKVELSAARVSAEPTGKAGSRGALRRRRVEEFRK
ncbi:MAG: hypothetical protein Q7J98_00570 [Kiritimatiellia bacterium]|nr:hypothetical protein [Kiritimatiellia bacterium]